MRCLVCVIASALALTANLPAQTEADLRSLELNGRLIRYQVRAGFAVVQGDIIIGTAAAAEASQRSSTSKSPAPLASILNFDTNPRKWPNATMPYVIDPDIPNPQRILDGIAHWNARTRLRIVAQTTEANYVHFVRDSTLDAACGSSLGMIGGSQAILTTDACTAGSVVHELGHAWGLQHEQSRVDRNANLTVLYQNMDKRFLSQFDQRLTTSKDTGYYDFGSIMHYSSTAFTRNGLDTMETVPVGIPIGQLNGLSAGDIDGISRAYGLTPTATTIATVPSGLPIIVDGVAALSPKSFDWEPGSTHTLSVNTQAGSADPRYIFVRWSDGGDLSHTITVDPGQTVFCAMYQTQHRFSVGTGFSSVPGFGTVAAFPISIDGYYPERQPVRITATPEDGSQFVRWTGITNLVAAGYSVSATDAIVEVLSANTQYVGTFSTLPLTTIDSAPHGRVIAVDGTSYLTPVRFAWAGGSTHALDLNPSQTSGNNTVHYQFTGWDDGGSAAARTVTAGSALVFTAGFSTKYLLTTDMIGAGRVTVSPSSPDGYYDAGTKVQITAVPISGSALLYWLGDFAGGTLEKSITMDDQHDVTAYFANAPFTVFNAASFLPNIQVDLTAGRVLSAFAVTPGEIITIFGTNLGPAALATAQFDASGNIATALAGTRVFFDGVPSPIIYTSATQLSVVVPFAVTGKAVTVVRTQYNGVLSPSLAIGVVDSAPALLTANASGTGQIAALNEDYSINSPSRPAEPNTVVQMYATGAGPWTESIPDGQIIGSHLVAPKAPVYARVGKLPAQILYVGTAPSLVNGALQINILLPKELIGGPAVPIQISVGNYTSPPGTTLAVR